MLRESRISRRSRGSVAGGEASPRDVRKGSSVGFWCYLASLGNGTPRLIVAMALGGTLFVSLVVVFTGVWPMAWIDDLGVSWLGRSSLRWRITGAFVVFGSMLLAMMLGALLAKKAWKALSEQGGTF